MELERAYVSALASISKMLSPSCLPLMHFWSLCTVFDATEAAGMSSREEVILLSVLESEIGRVSLGSRMNSLLWSLSLVPLGGNNKSAWL